MTSVSEVVSDVLEAARTVLTRECDVAVIDTDTEVVHRARVATRTVRSHLATLRPLLDQDAVRPVTDDLRWLGRCLGRVRDLDVLVASVHVRLETRDDPSDEATMPLLGRLDSIHRDRLEDLRHVLAEPRFLGLLTVLRDAAADPPVRSAEIGRRKARALIPALAWGDWVRVDRPLRGRPPDDWTDPRLHEVRKRAKRARFAANLAHPLVDGSTPAFVTEMKRLLRPLGALQDAVTARAWMRSISTDATTDEAFLAGVLAAGFDDDAALARAGFLNAWDPRRIGKAGRWMR